MRTSGTVRRSVVAVSFAAVLLASGCGHKGPSDAERFCKNIDDFQQTAQIVPSIDVEHESAFKTSQKQMLTVVEALQKVVEEPPAALKDSAKAADDMLEKIHTSIVLATDINQLRDQVSSVIRALTQQTDSATKLAPLQAYAKEHCPNA